MRFHRLYIWQLSAMGNERKTGPFGVIIRRKGSVCDKHTHFFRQNKRTVHLKSLFSKIRACRSLAPLILALIPLTSRVDRCCGLIATFAGWQSSRFERNLSPNPSYGYSNADPTIHRGENRERASGEPKRHIGALGRTLRSNLDNRKGSTQLRISHGSDRNFRFQYSGIVG